MESKPSTRATPLVPLSSQITIRSLHDTATAIGAAGSRTLMIDRPEHDGGHGLGFNGGELLLLAIGACYCNDLHRTAARRGMSIGGVDITVAAQWANHPLRLQAAQALAHIETKTHDADLDALIEAVDCDASVARSLRLGTRVALARTALPTEQD